MAPRKVCRPCKNMQWVIREHMWSPTKTKKRKLKQNGHLKHSGSLNMPHLSLSSSSQKVMLSLHCNFIVSSLTLVVHTYTQIFRKISWWKSGNPVINIWTTQIKHEHIILGKIIQTDKDKYCMTVLTCGL